MRLDSEQQFIEHEEAAERRAHRRQQAELFDPAGFRHTTPEEREVQAFYAHQAQICECNCTLGMHDFPPTTECHTPGCGCQAFRPKYERMVMKPSGEIKPVSEEAA